MGDYQPWEYSESNILSCKHFRPLWAVIWKAVDSWCGGGGIGMWAQHFTYFRTPWQTILTVKKLNWAMLPGAHLISIQFLWLPHSDSMPTKPPPSLSLGSSRLSSGNSVPVTGGSDPITVIVHSALASGPWWWFCFLCSLILGRDFEDDPSANFLISRKCYFSNSSPSLLSH